MILRKHYRGQAVQGRIEANAKAAAATFGNISTVLYFDETGKVINDHFEAAVRAGQTELIQKLGRFYTLTVIRWLADLFSELSSAACRQHNPDVFFGLEEFFQTFTVADKFLKRTKVWP